MRELYTRAWTPIVWLGEQENYSHNALDLITTLSIDYSSRASFSRLPRDHQKFERVSKGCWRTLYHILFR